MLVTGASSGIGAALAPAPAPAQRDATVAFEHFFSLLADGRIDLSGMLTHRFPLDQWRQAFTTIVGQGDTGAIKVAFDFTIERQPEVTDPA